MPERSGDRCVPKTLPDFQQHFPNEEACIAHLYSKRFPDGFVCHYCEHSTKVMLGRLTPLLVAPLSTVAATANGTRASLPGRSCTGANSRFTHGSGRPFS